MMKHTVDSLMELHDKAVDEATKYDQMCFNGYDIQPVLDASEALRAALTEALKNKQDLYTSQERVQISPESVHISQPVPPHECKTYEEKLAYAAGWWKALEANGTQPVRVPLTDEDISDIWDSWLINITDKISAIQFAREIDKAHGIGGDK